MDKCRAFDVWLNKRLCEMEAIGLDEAFYAGWQSRQAEIDQLKGLLEKDEYAHSLYYENLNLQTSIDEKDKKLNAVEQILNDLKESMISFKEMDLYDKGVRVITQSTIEDLEKALRGKNANS